MGTDGRGSIVREMDRLLTRGVAPTGDGDLLERFGAHRDEEAFEALVVRHGPMVRGVCRRALRDPYAIDEAFQATFLVLARKGNSLRDPDRLGPWLHGVASRVAAKARARSGRRTAEPLPDDLPARDDRRAEWSDVFPIVDAEIARLPPAHRDVLTACLLGGASEQEAARSLRCAVGTVKSRLSRAKEALRGRLVKRGVVPAAALAAASAESFASPVASELVRATLAQVSAKAAIPASVAALTQGVAPTMITRTILAAATLVGGLAIAGLSATAWTADPPPAAEPPPPATKAAPETRRQLENNLKAIMLAFHNYTSAQGAFPPVAIRSADGRPLLSWRVALLPYLDQKALYDQFHLDEPWDGPHNRPLVDRMPAVFDAPGFPAPPGKTRIRGVDAPGTVFGPPTFGDVAFRVEDVDFFRADSGGKPKAEMAAMAGSAPPHAEGQPQVKDARIQEAASERGDPLNERGRTFSDVHDGLSNTAAVVVAEDPTDWTRPGELTIQGDLGAMGNATLPALVDDGPDGYILGMADGAVQRLPWSLTRRQVVFPAVLTMAGGEVLSSDVFAKVPEQAEPAPTDKPSAVPASFDRRLRRVEEKLDDILDRLDALAPPKP